MQDPYLQDSIFKSSAKGEKYQGIHKGKVRGEGLTD